jgi:signal transduction histidine kinase
VINRSGATTALYVDSFVAPLLQELGGSDTMSPQNVETLTRLLQETSLGRQIVAFKVWDLTGRVVFSTDASAIGQAFPIHDALLQASQGEVSSRLSVEEEENAPQRAISTELLEIYSPVRLSGTNQIIAVAEYYQAVDELKAEITAAQQRSWFIVAGVMGLIFILLSGFIRKASDTIEHQQLRLNQQITRLTDLLAQNKVLNERVKRAAANVTTSNERFLRRIGSELHDGPAQDLGLALLELDAVLGRLEKEPSTSGPESFQPLGKIQSLLQNTLKEMRAIAGGLALPQLADLSVAETVLRAVRGHERRTGTSVEVSIEAVPEGTSLPIKITVYRLVQEALTNAYRHAGGVGQEVRVAGIEETLSIEVCDQGPGFEFKPGRDMDGHLGLAGMQERVESLGGYFQVHSQAGQGTRVAVILPLKTGGEADE